MYMNLSEIDQLVNKIINIVFNNEVNQIEAVQMLIDCGIYMDLSLLLNRLQT